MSGVRRIKLTQGRYALVSAEDYDRVKAAGPWYAMRAEHLWYAARGVYLGGGRSAPRRVTVRMHTSITGYEQTDHINGHGLDNRRVNLRGATAAQNAHNRYKQRNNTSGYIGVSRRSTVRWVRWRAQIQVDGKNLYLGMFGTAKEAARVRDQAARLYHGEFAKLNFPNEE